MKFLMIYFFLFSSLLISVNSIGQTKNKTAPPKKSYQKLDNGKEVEIIEDSVVADGPVPLKIPAVNKMPLKEFDTSLIPQDIFTQHIEELLKTTNVVAIAKNIMNKMIASLGNKDAENEQLQLFYKRFLVKVNTPSFNNLFVNLYTRTYRKFFTDEDLTHLLNFYKTPTGKKYLQVLPAISSASMAEGEKLGKYFGSLVFYEMEEEKRNK